VSTAATAADAMEQIRARPPDVLISDLGMAGQDGYDLIRAVRALPPDGGGKVPAAALSAFARSEDRRRAMMSGFQTHVAKPVEAAELIALVASLAGRVGR
jgi:CheY-like chemotaxis protein